MVSRFTGGHLLYRVIRTQSEKEESFRSKYEGLKQEEFEWWTMEPIIELPEGCSAAGKECKVDANQLTGENGKLKEAEWKERLKPWYR